MHPRCESASPDKQTLPSDLDALLGKAQELGFLQHDVIVDVTHSRGGHASAWVIQRLTSKRFKGTYGNIRISDVLPGFIAKVRASNWDEPREHGLLQWLEHDVTRAAQAGAAYSQTVPFKLFHMPKTADGWFEPAALHFEGRLACIFGPRGGSNLDQFGAMIVDNDLGFTVGLPLGGYSNTWEWSETLRMPETGELLVEYMWSIGHTIRPNGEILEGNPAQPQHRLPLSADNFRDYHDHAHCPALALSTYSTDAASPAADRARAPAVHARVQARSTRVLGAAVLRSALDLAGVERRLGLGRAPAGL